MGFCNFVVGAADGCYVAAALLEKVDVDCTDCTGSMEEDFRSHVVDVTSGLILQLEASRWDRLENAWQQEGKLLRAPTDRLVDARVASLLLMNSSCGIGRISD